MLQKTYNFDYKKYEPQLLSILQKIANTKNCTPNKLSSILAQFPKDGNKIFSKNNLVTAYKALLAENHPNLPSDPDLLKKIQMKPIRTASGVTPVTILTKPFPCPGKCIFCPNDIRMPKSYLSDEPGAQRAERNAFDPYLQTFDRLKALQNIGHNTDKIEIIILGGTWSYYPEPYQIWFIKRCFEAMNDFGEGQELDFWALNSKLAKINHREQDKNHDTIRNTSNPITKNSDVHSNQSYNQIIAKKNLADKQKTQEEISTWEELFFEHKRNEIGKVRCVGLVIETRPDNISPEEVIRIRKLGCTKTQIGFQILNDEVLKLNHRGHDVAATRKAVELLRYAGFKIHAHWMANLYGSNPQEDIKDYQMMFSDPDFRPDELKVYPCSLIDTAELMDYYNKGLWKPYSHEELLEVVVNVIKDTPEYCRLTRIIRDIPGTDIVTGNKITNFRQIAENEMDKRNIERNDIRSREIGNQEVSRSDLRLKTQVYHNSIGTEVFLQFVTKENKIAGFLRLELPALKLEEKIISETSKLSDIILDGRENSTFKHPFISELDNAAMIREIHIYGKTAEIGEKGGQKAQHLGLGTELINWATDISKNLGFQKLAVISAIGTREYYRKRDFEDGELYLFKNLIG